MLDSLKEQLVKQNRTESLVIKFPKSDKKDLIFPKDVLFPHTFLKKITSKTFFWKQKNDC